MKKITLGDTDLTLKDTPALGQVKRAVGAMSQFPKVESGDVDVVEIIDVSIALVAEVTGKTVAEIEAIPAGLNDLVLALRDITIGGGMVPVDDEKKTESQ